MPVFKIAEKLGDEKRNIIKISLMILAKLLDADGCSFMLKDEEKDEIEIVAAGEATADAASKKLGIRVKAGERIAGRCAAEQKPFLIVGDISQNKNFTHLRKYEEISSGLSVPAIKNGKVLGVINAKKTVSKEILSQQDLETAKTIANVMAEEL